MLNIYFGDMPDAVFDTARYFNNQYKDAWITKERTVRMVKDIGKSDVIDANLIQSPYLGAIGPRNLSGGVKTLILLDNDRSGRVFNASTCGDNCAKWLLEIATDRKVVVNMHHLMDFGKGPWAIRVLNTNTVVRNMRDLVFTAGDYV